MLDLLICRLFFRYSMNPLNQSIAEEFLADGYEYLCILFHFRMTCPKLDGR